MRYTIGDKVKIKDQRDAGLHNEVEAWLENLDPPRVVEINEFEEFFYPDDRYSVKGAIWLFEDDQIEEKYEWEKLFDEKMMDKCSICGCKDIEFDLDNRHIVCLSDKCGAKYILNDKELERVKHLL